MASEVTTPSVTRGNYRSYSTAQKLRAVEMANENGVRATASLLKVPLSTLGTWKAQVSSGTFPKKLTGRPITYSSDVEQEIVDWVLRRREQNLPVPRYAIAEHARKVVKTPGFKATPGWLDKFMRRNDLVMRAKTSVAQRLPADLTERVRVFHRHVRELHQQHEFDAVINMDETPVFFDLVPGKTVDRKGVKDVTIRTTGAEKRHITVTLAVSANGDKLPPLVIFKGQRFPPDITHIPEGMIVRMQQKAWMTEDIMVDWVREVLRPYTKKKRTMLVMDSFAGHTTSLVTKELWQSNVTPAVIPGGCTSKVQPLDVSINKPFKSHLRKLWTEWIASATEQAEGGIVSTASRQLILEWVSEAWDKLDPAIIPRSFGACGITAAVDEAATLRDANRRQLLEALAVDESSTEFEGFGAEEAPVLPDVGEDPFMDVE